MPEPGPDQIRVRVRVCGVLPHGSPSGRRRPAAEASLVVPGHEVVTTVDALGSAVTTFAPGDQVGIPWLARTCGICPYCERNDENLCLAPAFTGWDRDGGYAEYAIAEAGYVYALPAVFGDEEAAPLLCAGIIGYRAWWRANVPPGGRLGIYGFGASAHLTAQVAIAEGSTRSRGDAAFGPASSPSNWARPRQPGRRTSRRNPWTRPSYSPPSEPWFRRHWPPWTGGTLAIAGIHLTDIPPLNYEGHLFQERNLRSITANTRQDGRDFLALAARIGLQVTTTPYPLDEADRAVRDLAHDRVNGAAVLLAGA